jgi:hypothetical protein
MLVLCYQRSGCPTWIDRWNAAGVLEEPGRAYATTTFGEVLHFFDGHRALHDRSTTRQHPSTLRCRDAVDVLLIRH